MKSSANVLVVDDSTFTRKAICRMLGGDPALKVVGQAADGLEALSLMRTLPVDVVTLDLEMPGLDGLSTLERLKQEYHVPVVVLSGTAAAGAASTLQALDLGAFDVVAKPSGGHLAIHNVARELIAKVRGAAGLPAAAETVEQPVYTPAPIVRPAPRPAAQARPAGRIDVVLIGISTGGPPALQRVLPRLPADFPVPIVVLQHMPPGYTRALAERLDRLSPIAIREAADDEPLLPGTVLIAPSGHQLSFRRSGAFARVHVQEDCPFPSYYRPSIDFSFQEAARVFGANALGVIMTGMGADGTEGLRVLRGTGAQGWCQDEATSTIYGMPRSAAEAGLADAIFALDELPERLVAAVAGVRRGGGAPSSAE